MNRFDRRASVRSNFIPQNYEPNFALLAQALQQQQTQYDSLQEAANKLPQYLQADQDDVLAYKQSQEDRLSQVAQAYQRSLQEGNLARKQLLYDTKQDFSPTGRAYGFQQNYDSAQAYIKRLDELKSKGKITNETYNAAINRSMQDFGKSYTDNNFKQFSGYQTAEDINILEVADEFLDGWKPDTINGRKVGKTYNGQYFYTDTNTQEFVKPEDVRKAAVQAISADPQSMAYLRQQQDLMGKDPMQLVNQTADALAGKYGYLKNTTKRNWHKDYILEESIKQKNRKELLKEPIEHMNTMLFKSGYEHNKVTNATWERGAGLNTVQREIDRLESVQAKTKGNLTKAQQKQLNALRKRKNSLENSPTNKVEAASEFLSFLESPEAEKTYPGMQKLREQFPRNTKELNGTKVYENDAEYMERLQTAYNTLGEKRSVEKLKFIKYGADEMKNINAEMFGTSNNIGNAKQYMYYPISTNNKPGAPMTWDQVKDQLGIKKNENPVDIRKNFGVAGKVSPDNPIHPSGVILNATSGNGDAVFVASTNSIEDANYLSPIHQFASPLTNPMQENEFGVGFGSPILLQSGDQTLPVVGKVVPVFNDDGTQVSYREEVYSINQDGSLGDRLPLTINDVVTQEEAKNPFANQRK